MFSRVAVNFRGRCLKNSRFDSLCQAEYVDGAHDARLDGFNRVILVVNRRGGTGEVVNLINFEKNGKGDVVSHELEVTLFKEMRDIPLPAREIIIEADDIMPFVHEPFTEV
jgi:hypothetical protein